MFVSCHSNLQIAHAIVVHPVGRTSSQNSCYIAEESVLGDRSTCILSLEDGRAFDV
jgi:hypothetical protein